MEPLAVKPKANITITFATTQENGILFYTGRDQHLAIELFRGRIRVSYDVGNYPVSTMFSYEIVADGQYHHVEILAVKKKFTLKVDGGLARSIINEGKNEYLEPRSPMYISGTPGEVGQHALNHWHLRNATSFNGCVKELYINGKLVDFLQAATTRHKISPGCGWLEDSRQEPDPSPCDRKPCKHGSCSVTSSHPGFQCKCSRGYAGELCDIKGKLTPD